MELILGILGIAVFLLLVYISNFMMMERLGRDDLTLDCIKELTTNQEIISQRLKNIEIIVDNQKSQIRSLIK